MGKLSTHVLDTSVGKPAKNLSIKLYKRVGNQSILLKTIKTNDDGRCDKPLLEGEEFTENGYELEFDVRQYFANNNIDSVFLQDVVIRFYIENSSDNYHIPLLLSPFSYSTYKGS